jgi:MoxR-like ATPase
MQSLLQNLIETTSEIVLDKKPEIELAVTCLLAGGHLLIEDVPGVGKTTLVQTLGRLSGLGSCRIQFTVDLLPADILGGQIYNSKEQKFQFHPGPLFHQMVLADELNRASPRTQGALLQAMEENSVSIDGVTHDLPTPFFVIATQNPHQQTGTFPLPESQLDRFLMSLELNYASAKTEIALFQATDPRERMQKLKPILSPEEFTRLKAQAQEVKISEIVAKYVSALLEVSRNRSKESLPISTRGGINLVRAAKAWAFLNGRGHLQPEDIQKVLVPVFGHRMGGQHGLRKGREWAQELQTETPVPV